VAYGARLEIVLGVKALAGSNPASSASYQRKRLAPTNAGARRSSCKRWCAQFRAQLYLSNRHEHARRAVVALVVIAHWFGPHEPADHRSTEPVNADDLTQALTGSSRDTAAEGPDNPGS
jgi:hypothetical protein